MTLATPEISAPTLIVPEPGIYPGIPNEVYHRQWDAVNKSSLDWIADYSPMHCHYWRENPEDTTEALTLGQALHCLALQPDSFDSEFVLSDKCSAVKKGGSPCDNPGKFMIGG